jgi:hypothetical protein
MRISRLLIFLLPLAVIASCAHKTPDLERTPLLEVEGKFLYLDQVQQVIPPNAPKKDSSEIAGSYIRKWVTDVLMYENAKRNITNESEIDQLVEDYRKSLTIHQYQQKMIEERLPKEPSEAEMQAFYKKYSEQLGLKENIIQGLLLIIPNKAQKISSVRSWVQSGNTKSLENIEKYSIQNAISYDYFGDKWMPFAEILKKMPIQVQDPSNYVASHRFVETSDSTQHYFLRIEAYRIIGQVEPYEMAKDKIANILLNKHKSEFILQFEKELYDDAVKDEDVSFFKK